MSIHVIRPFVTLRRESGRYADLARKLAELEHNQQLHGEDIQMILNASVNWMKSPAGLTQGVGA